MNHFEYLFPVSLDAAVDELINRTKIAVLAGGTDLIPRLKQRVANPDSVLNLAGIPELKEIKIREDDLFIGSMVTLARVIEDPLIGRHVPALVESAQCVASPQIRNQGTVGGNLLQARRCFYFNQSDSWRANLSPCFELNGKICHQVPTSTGCRALYYSDLAPVLLAFDASAEILDGERQRSVSLRDLIHSHVTEASGKFILKGILVPLPSAGTWSKFVKQSLRSAVDFAVSNAALRYSPRGSKGKTGPLFRMCVGAVSPEPFLLDETGEEFVHSGAQWKPEDLAGRAIEEARRKMALIREPGILPSVKKDSLGILRRAFEELLVAIPHS